MACGHIGASRYAVLASPVSHVDEPCQVAVARSVVVEVCERGVAGARGIVDVGVEAEGHQSAVSADDGIGGVR